MIDVGTKLFFTLLEHGKIELCAHGKDEGADENRSYTQGMAPGFGFFKTNFKLVVTKVNSYKGLFDLDVKFLNKIDFFGVMEGHGCERQLYLFQSDRKWFLQWHDGAFDNFYPYEVTNLEIVSA